MHVHVSKREREIQIERERGRQTEKERLYHSNVPIPGNFDSFYKKLPHALPYILDCTVGIGGKPLFIFQAFMDQTLCRALGTQRVLALAPAVQALTVWVGMCW